MIQGSFYDIESGEIRGVFDMPGPIFPPDEGWSWISGHWPVEQFYVVNACPVAKQTLPIEVNGSVISGLPDNTVIDVDGEQFIVDDGIADLRFALPGRYTVNISCFPYLPATLEFNV